MQLKYFIYLMQSLSEIIYLQRILLNHDFELDLKKLYTPEMQGYSK